MRLPLPALFNDRYRAGAGITMKNFTFRYGSGTVTAALDEDSIRRCH